MTRQILFILLIFISTNVYPMQIITIDNDRINCLSKKAKPINISSKGLLEAQKIVDQLKTTLLKLMPAAGLAAPQIGISKQVFIFSWDRTEDHLEIAINPSFEPIGNEMLESWEACFSGMLSNGTVEAALLKRYKKISATYTDLNGKVHNKILENFAAKVFQHEYDHLAGIVNVRRKDAKVKIFDSKAEMIKFVTNANKKSISSNYTPPVPIEK